MPVLLKRTNYRLIYPPRHRPTWGPPTRGWWFGKPPRNGVRIQALSNEARSCRAHNGPLARDHDPPLSMSSNMADTRLGADANFFDLGANSLMMVRVVEKIRGELGL